MKKCPLCIEFEADKIEMIEDDEQMCGYCFDTIHDNMPSCLTNGD